MAYERDLNLKATELRLGLPGTHHEPDEKQSLSSSRTNKRTSPEISEQSSSNSNPSAGNGDRASAPPTKAHVVGWPPIRSYRKNCLQPKKDETDGVGMYVKVSMDGVPYLRKIDVRVYKNYPELLKGLENMFKLIIGEYSEREGYNGSDYCPIYEDKDGDWMLVGDVPWSMFICSCKRLRIMKESEARGLGCV